MLSNMAKKDYTATILADKSPEEVFKAINNVRKWWSGEITGRTDRLGAVGYFGGYDMMNGYTGYMMGGVFHNATCRIQGLLP